MKRHGLLRLCLILLGLAGAIHPSPAWSQGITTAAITGRVLDESGQPISGVQITVAHLGTGIARSTLTNSVGQYFLPGLQVGGPYRLEVSTLGFGTEVQEGFSLALGQNLQLNFNLRAQVIELDGIDVTVSRTSREVIRPNRTGAEQLVTEHQIRNLPTISRNFTDFIKLSPLVGAGGGATSVGQQNNRFNNVQIDGALSQDLFGLGSTGQPGGQAGARSISMEAVKEYQVLAAPFDVRQSGFTGGLINAVTKTGTNDFRGSVYGAYRNQDFVRSKLPVDGTDVPFGSEFTNKIYGGTLSGPIIRDRVHFFTAVEIENDVSPAGNIAVGRDPVATTGIAVTDAQRFADLLTQKGVNPGSFTARNRENPNRNIFARIDAQLTPVHQLTVRHNYVRAEDDIPVNRAPGSRYSLDSNWYFFGSTTNSTVVQLNSVFGNGTYNEFTFGMNRIRDRRAPNEAYPVISVSVPNAAGSGTKTLMAGAEYFSQGNELDQDSWELTNSLSFRTENQRITVGVHNELFKFRNLFWPGMTGEWVFSSLDDFAAGNASRFNRNIPYRAGADPTATFMVNQFALYAQTEYRGFEDLVLTAGIRYDVPLVLDKPENNPAIETAFGRPTDEVASGNGIFSPRLGANWDVFGDQSTQVRGGLGIFTGRHPYVWLSNLFSNTGLSTVSLSCTGASVPAFTLDPNNPPSQCAAGSVPQPPTAVINLIDPDFKYPHNWRFNAAVDQRLPWGVVGTAEFMYSRAVKQILLREVNVNFDSPVSLTQGGREVYGTHTAGPLASGADNRSLASPNRLSNAALSVVELGNSDQDRSWSMTLQAQKRYSDGLDLNASYTMARAKDLSGLTSSIATSNLGYNPVQGSPNNPVLSASDYETRNKVVLSAAYDVRSWFTASMVYLGHSSEGYSYTYDGDVNADGFEASYANGRNNDLLYVPNGPGDITLTDPADWTRINTYIQGESCLRENRGNIMSRNACREPWQNRVDTRFAFKLPTIRGQQAELGVDITNFLNLLNAEWGRSEGVTFQTIELLELRGWDYANNRGIFRPTGNLRLDSNDKPIPYTTFDLSSRWQMIVGLRYAF